jgi:hypothetical protein
MSGRNFCSVGGSSNTRSTAAIVFVAAIGYVAGALVQDSLPRPNDQVAFAQPVRSAKPNSDDTLAAGATATEPRANKLRRSDANGTEDPRECDLAKGISTACIFMD